MERRVFVVAFVVILTGRRFGSLLLWPFAKEFLHLQEGGRLGTRLHSSVWSGEAGFLPMYPQNLTPYPRAEGEGAGS